MPAHTDRYASAVASYLALLWGLVTGFLGGLLALPVRHRGEVVAPAGR